MKYCVLTLTKEHDRNTSTYEHMDTLKHQKKRRKIEKKGNLFAMQVVNPGALERVRFHVV